MIRGVVVKKLFYIKKRGFTLIELLAVIVILAIILLIIMPIILNIISDARKGAFEASARGIIKAAENDCMVDLLNDEVSAKEISFSDYIASEEINFAGQGPKEGTIYVNEACEIAMAVHDEQWCVIKDYDDTNITTFVYEGSCVLEVEPAIIFGENPASLDGVDFFDGTPEKGMIVFKTPGEYEIVPETEEEVEVLVVAAGSYITTDGNHGGPGAGGLVYKNNFQLVNQAVSIVVGEVSWHQEDQNSEIGDPNNDGIRALGGGRRGVAASDGTDGGSGGGGGCSYDTAGSGGSAQQPISMWGGYGNDGGDGYLGNEFTRAGGGGGGAGSSGGNATNNMGGAGGDGLEFFGHYYSAGIGGMRRSDDSRAPNGIGYENRGSGGQPGIVIIRWGGYNMNYDPTDDSVTSP